MRPDFFSSALLFLAIVFWEENAEGNHSHTTVEDANAFHIVREYSNSFFDFPLQSYRRSTVEAFLARPSW